MAGLGPYNAMEAAALQSPTGDFTGTVDTDRYTCAVLIAADSVDTVGVVNSAAATVQVPVAFQVVPLRTIAALTGTTGFTVIYCYPDEA